MALDQPTAPVSQLFSSFQGEGPRVGLKTLFLRLRGCNWNCDYCDTDTAVEGEAWVETAPGSRRFQRRSNPLSLSDVAEALSSLNASRPGHADLAVTGGEPLLHASFLNALLPAWLDSAEPRPHVLLETNGTLPEALRETLVLWDTVSMDIKLESATGQPTPWERHAQFLETLREARNVVVKLVVGRRTELDELRRVLALLQTAALDGPQIVVQPATRVRPAEQDWPIELDCPPSSRLLAMLDLFAMKGFTARVIPQTHKLLGEI